MTAGMSVMSWSVSNSASSLAAGDTQNSARAGLSDFQAVIDSERTVASLEDDLVASEAAIAGSLVAIHKALGGSATQASR